MPEEGGTSGGGAGSIATPAREVPEEQRDLLRDRAHRHGCGVLQRGADPALRVPAGERGGARAGASAARGRAHGRRAGDPPPRERADRQQQLLQREGDDGGVHSPRQALPRLRGAAAVHLADRPRLSEAGQPGDDVRELPVPLGGHRRLAARPRVRREDIPEARAALVFPFLSAGAPGADAVGRREHDRPSPPHSAPLLLRRLAALRERGDALEGLLRGDPNDPADAGASASGESEPAGASRRVPGEHALRSGGVSLVLPQPRAALSRESAVEVLAAGGTREHAVGQPTRGERGRDA